MVIQRARALAARLGRPTLGLTFDPHPRLFFQPGMVQFRLTPPDVQAGLMARAGLDGLITLTFDTALAGQGAQAFIDELLVRRLNISGLVVGADFHFGKGRQGTPAMLQQAAAAKDFVVDLIDPVAEGVEPISSTRIRHALMSGDVGVANRLLGYEWFVRGPVIHGEKRGRDLGYPTANMKLEPGCGLKHGIYAVRVTIDGAVHAGVASFGRRPTFDNGAPLLETHLFDFKGDLYGRSVDVVFVRYLRGEEKFDSIAALVAQMDRDSAEARAALREPKI